MLAITFNIWAVIVLLGAVQGFFLSFYLILLSKNKRANKWLAFLLLAVSLHLLEYAADISGITFQYPYLIAITYPLLFCMGPLYFLYCRCLLDKNFKLTWKALLHFIPAVLILCAMLPFYTMPASEKLTFMIGLVDGNSINIPVEQLVIMGLHVLQTVAYIFAANRLTQKKEKEFKHFSSDVLIVKKMEWLKGFNAFFSVYLLLYLILIIILAIIDSNQAQVDYVMLLITSFSIYAVGYTALRSPEVFREIPDLVLKEPGTGIEPTPDLPRNGNRHSQLTERLLVCMESNKPYLKYDLRISDLADLLSVPPYQLSQAINDGFSVNFYDFINKYRIEEAKKLLVEDSRNFKVLAIAYEVGFNSKATFNRVFKKFTGVTPSWYRKMTLLND